MPQKRSPSSRDGLIHCENCGENYSDTYRRCPFCNGSNSISGDRRRTRRDEYEYDGHDEFEEEPTRSIRGGKRLATSSTSTSSRSQPAHSSSAHNQDAAKITPFQVISVSISLLVILAAILIVVTKLAPLIRQGNVSTVDASAPPEVSDSAGLSSEPGVLPETNASSPPESIPTNNVPSIPVATQPPVETQPPVVTQPPAATPTAPPTAPPAAPPASGPTDFSLSKEDVTLLKKGEVWKPGVTFSPSGTTGSLTWKSNNANVATVSADGTITAVGLGTTTITATLSNGTTHSCVVRCKWTEATAAPTTAPTTVPTTAPTTAPTANSGSTSYAINNPDFTLKRVGEPFTLKVNGYTGTVSWSSSNSAVASVGSDGTCTAVANGTCTVTGTLDDGSTVQAIVRVKIEN